MEELGSAISACTSEGNSGDMILRQMVHEDKGAAVVPSSLPSVPVAIDPDHFGPAKKKGSWFGRTVKTLAAGALIAGFLRPGESQIFSQRIEQGAPRFNVNLEFLAIDDKLNENSAWSSYHHFFRTSNFYRHEPFLHRMA